MKYKVNIIESERGWGARLDEVKYFDTFEAAYDFVKAFNSQNRDEVAPDWYMRAEGPYPVVS